MQDFRHCTGEGAMHERFADRRDVGQALARKLEHLDPARTVILALPRGGVPVAAEVARSLGAPLDLMLVRKIGAPGQPELAVGAIAEGSPPQTAVNMDVARVFGLSRAMVEEMGHGELGEIARRRALYLKNRKPMDLSGKTAVLIDDGIATGATVRAGLMALVSRKAERVVLAVPLAPAEVIAEMSEHADEIICLTTPDPFIAVGNHYERFEQTSDEEVIALVEAFGPPKEDQQAN
jgi:putative phosphoribosyl transferase